MVEHADLACAGVGAIVIRPAVVALHADHEATGRLVVATGLDPANPPVQIMLADGLALKRAALGAHDPFLAAAPKAARMPARIATGKAPSRLGVIARLQTPSHRGACERNQSDCGDD